MIIDFRGGNGGGGGSSTNIIPLEATENKIYEAPEGNAFNPVTVDVKAKVQEKTATTNGDVLPDEGFDGLSKVNVNVPSEVLDLTGTGWENEKVFPVCIARQAQLKKDIEYTRTKFKEWDPSRTSAKSLYERDSHLIYAPKIDTSKVTDMSYCFWDCVFLTTIPELNTAQVTNMYYCFGDCSSLTSIPQLDTSKVTDMYGCFSNCNSLTTIPLLDTSKVTNMFYCFNNCTNLTDLGGFTGLKTSLDLSSSTKLTKQSLLNVIAGLATGVSYRLTLGQTNYDKLTADEIKVGTDKGWGIVA